MSAVEVRRSSGPSTWNRPAMLISALPLEPATGAIPRPFAEPLNVLSVVSPAGGRSAAGTSWPRISPPGKAAVCMLK